MLDNECLKAIKTFVVDQQTAIQLVEPHNHHVNASEVAVKTAKYHFIAALATVAPECPLQLWCSFLPQVETSLDLLRTSRHNLTISTYEDLHGVFDYNKTPMAPFALQQSCTKTQTTEVPGPHMVRTRTVLDQLWSTIETKNSGSHPRNNSTSPDPGKSTLPTAQ